MSSSLLAILCGGTSSEREVSLRSAATVEAALRDAGYAVRRYDTATDIPAFVHDVQAGLVVQLAVPVLHGAGGEDGAMQGFLETLKVPYLFSGVRASSIGMDKRATKLLAAAAGVPVACDVMLYPGSALSFVDLQVRLGSDTIVIKPVDAGSSVGVSIVRSAAAFPAALQLAFAQGDTVMAEQYISGGEYTVGIRGEGSDAEVIGITRIIPVADSFYSYEAKYADGGSRHECPAQLPEATAQAMRQAALATYRAVGCRDIARVDFIVDDATNTPYMIEINTIPGMTATSLIPEMIAARGERLSAVLAALVCARLDAA